MAIGYEFGARSILKLKGNNNVEVYLQNTADNIHEQARDQSREVVIINVSSLVRNITIKVPKNRIESVVPI